MAASRHMQRALPPAGAAAIAAALLLLVQLAPASAYTTTQELVFLEDFRAEVGPKSPNWQNAVKTWKCPTPAVSSTSTCDPCGTDTIGNWYHLHCRGNSMGWGESGDGTRDGMLTNIHICLENVDGPVPREACKFTNIREFDFKGSHLVGPMPYWLDCFRDLQELDNSNGRLSGTLPVYLTRMPNLTEIKYNNNYGIFGPIPREYGAMRGLRRLLLSANKMSGRVPDTFLDNLESPMTEFSIHDNDFEGDLYGLSNARLVITKIWNNPRLCGMVPRTVRYAAYYNPAGTNLGQPCPNERVASFLK